MMERVIRNELIALSTGIRLNVALAGEGHPIIFLHGFPESHRTWRHQVADLSKDHFTIAPDQRGFAASDKPVGVGNYEIDKIVEDVIALADALGVDGFTLVGHDWGGAAAWLTALTHPFRVKRLIIVNAPHPLIFQKSLIENEAQREASQYITTFRNPLAEVGLQAMGLEKFLDKVIGGHADPSSFSEEERRQYLHDWSQEGALTAMLNWYRASKIVVPAPGEEARAPIWTHAPFPHLSMPTLVVWGMKDTALLPIQLDGLEELVDDLHVEPIEDAGHFAPWERPQAVTAAIRSFLRENPV